MRTGEEGREEKVAHTFRYAGTGEGERMGTASGGAVGSMRYRRVSHEMLSIFFEKVHV